ncbi:type II toxin-antitoxin system PemK/MazF family toxin [Planctomycetota bacterium]
MDIIRRGEIYLVCLDPVFGREIGGFKMRPVVVVSISDMNRITRLVTVVPGTDAEHKRSDFDNVVMVNPNGSNGLRKPTLFQCHQIRAIERGRFTQTAKGRLSRIEFEEIEKAIGFCLGLSLVRPGAHSPGAASAVSGRDTRGSAR